MQYYSTLLAGECTRLALLYRIAGYDSFLAFCQGASEGPMWFRSSVLVAAAWTMRRHVHEMAKKAPWPFLALGDWRLADEQKKAVAESLARTAPRCLRPGLARKLRGLHEDAASLVTMLMSAAWQTIFLQLARVLRLSIAHIEWRHA